MYITSYGCLMPDEYLTNAMDLYVKLSHTSSILRLGKWRSRRERAGDKAPAQKSTTATVLNA